MDTIYLKVEEKLKNNVPDLKWIDAEMGQLEFYGDKPPVLFPCALIDIDLGSCEDNHAGEQHVKAKITVRYAFDPRRPTNSSVPLAQKTKALEYWTTVKKGYSTLQGFGDDELGEFTRKSQSPELRDDQLKVIRQVWETEFDEGV